MLLADINLVKNALTVAGVTITPEIKEILDSLELDADKLAAAKPMGLEPTWFGDSHSGGYRLATNANLAHEVVIEAFEGMADNLRHLGTQLEAYAKDVTGIDENDGVTYSNLATSTECISSPTFNAAACAAPTPAGGDS
ncbi:hypothetical protein DDE18_03670 [Nocardioides gansuensis]|uniref:Uncharacterized protein n=1 Tax=Nocardioides gansuensis TaxID=2138300 RepID=A0A2T8FG69_9ACTN|nr:hypothetical protein [Nocardioides gansuensis]PVG84706.1 hypothetical protein DDE18_03670 [Nocardioides gansuensis]